jgi:hypothetical protein
MFMMNHAEWCIKSRSRALIWTVMNDMGLVWAHDCGYILPVSYEEADEMAPDWLKKLLDDVQSHS